MKQVILIILLFFSIVNIANAIPIPALVIGWDFVILVVPAILGVFSAIYFYFRKYIFWINIYLLLFSIFLYFIHCNITKELFIFEYEYLLFLIFILLLSLIYKFKKLSFLNYLIILLLIGINFFLIQIDYNLYKFNRIYNRVEKNMYSNVKITKVLYKDNFMVIYGYDIESRVSAYGVLENGLLDSQYYLNKGSYYIVHGGNRWLGEGLANLIYKSIK